MNGKCFLCAWCDVVCIYGSKLSIARSNASMRDDHDGVCSSMFDEVRALCVASEWSGGSWKKCVCVCVCGQFHVFGG